MLKLLFVTFNASEHIQTIKSLSDGFIGGSIDPKMIIFKRMQDLELSAYLFDD